MKRHNHEYGDSGFCVHCQQPAEKHTPNAMAVRSASLRNLAVNQLFDPDALHDAADMLYDTSKALAAALNQRDQLLAQRNALLEACKAALLRLDHHDDQSAPEAMQLRNAIALAQGTP